MSDLENFKYQRTTLKGRVTRFKIFLETYADSNDNNIVKSEEKHNELWGEFNMIQTKIDELLSESEIAEQERFEDVFFQAAIRSKLAQNTKLGKRSGKLISHNAIANQTSIRLLIISLTFSGNYEQW